MDPLVGLIRTALSLEALEVMERASLIDEDLFAEASRYVETLSFSVGGQELSFSTSSSRFGRVVMKEGSFGGLTSVDGGEEPNLLSIILADGRSGEMTSEGEKTLVEEGVGSEDEELLQDLEGKGCRWDDSCLARFNKFLGFSTEGFKCEILNLLLRTKRKRE